MDMSFANQALCAEHIAKHHKDMALAVHDVPQEIDREVARLKLQAMGVSIDTLTEEQQKYLASWESGPHNHGPEHALPTRAQRAQQRRQPAQRAVEQQDSGVS